MRQTATLLLTSWIFLASSSSLSEDWPQWRGIHRDGKSPETHLLTEWPTEGPKLLWRTEGVGEGHASMAVADGFIYTTGLLEESGEGVLSALDLTGQIVWQTQYGPEWTGMYPGARTCPTIDNGRGYILSGMGLLLSFDPKSGDPLWTLNIDDEFAGIEPRVGYAESLLVDDEKVICTPGGEDASLVALEKTTGDTIWTTTGFSDQSAYCSPILVERGGMRLIVTVTARYLVGVDIETGALVWSAPFDSDAEDPNHSVSPVYQDGCIYITSGHRDGGCLYALAEDGKSIELRWTDDTLSCLHGGLVAVDGYVYGTSTKGRWICLDLGNGNVMYETRGVGMGSVIYADGMLYCYGEKGTFGLAKAHPGGYNLVSSFRIPGGKGPHWAHPVISDGRLYVRHGNAIMAYDISAR